MTFRWFGKSDPISLEKTGQIPGATGVVSALYDVPLVTRGPVTACSVSPTSSMPPDFVCR